MRVKIVPIFFSIFAVGFIGCSASPDRSSEINTTDELFTALNSAGINPERTGVSQRSGFETGGVIIKWGSSEIEVFEYQDEDKRSFISSKIDAEFFPTDEGVQDNKGEEIIWASGRIIVVYTGIDGGTILLMNGFLGDPLRYEAPEIDAPFPPAVVAAIRALAKQEKIEPGLIRVEGYEQVDWSDACLGLPSPGELCAQVITVGWRVELIEGENSYTLHTDAQGTQIRYASGLD